MTQPKYYGYLVPGSGTVLFGTEKEQIVNTLSYYKHQRGQQEIVLPSLDQIVELGKSSEINITAAFPMAQMTANISAEVRKKVIFHVNANAFDYVQQVAQSFEELKRGDLYKFKTIDAFGLWFLPEYIMQGIKGYDWGKHDKQVRSWLIEREKALGDLEREGHIVRVRPLRVPVTNAGESGHKNNKYTIN